VRKELNDWIETTVKVSMAETNRTMFSNLANTMSRSMFHWVLYDAVNMSYMNMRNALSCMGADTSRMPENPIQRPFQTPTP
jgi:ABC-type long-subunit fatty acid transport system fused permease/ATPase subunit